MKSSFQLFFLKIRAIQLYLGLKYTPTQTFDTRKTELITLERSEALNNAQEISLV